MSVADQVAQMVEQAAEAFGRIDVLVNNAAALPIVPFYEATEQQWDRMVDVNMKGTFLCSKAVTPRMIEQGGGRIINLASICSSSAQHGLTIYEATKGGIAMLTKGMALELGRYKINLNAIAPGTTVTEFNKDLLADPEVLRANIAHIPLGRLGKPEEMVGAAIFLASAESDYVTGHILYVVRVEAGICEHGGAGASGDGSRCVLSEGRVGLSGSRGERQAAPVRGRGDNSSGYSGDVGRRTHTVQPGGVYRDEARPVRACGGYCVLV